MTVQNRIDARIPGRFTTGVHTKQPHDSARKHVAGAAPYVDDLPEPPGTLHAALVLSPVAHGLLRNIDASAARAMPTRVGTNSDDPPSGTSPMFTNARRK